MKPEVFIMDEPTAGLDWKSAVELMNTAVELNEMGHTIILITHDMRIISEFTDRSIVLKDGEILMDGTTGRCWWILNCSGPRRSPLPRSYGCPTA